MPELMGDVRAEPKPGTAFRTMVKEHRHLDEFMVMVKAKMELDEKYLSELKTLHDSWNPDWNGSGVWPLISPLLTHIDNEIDEREKAVTELKSRLAALPYTPPPDASHENGLDVPKLLNNIKIRYSQYEQCHKIINTPDSIGELKIWRTPPLSSTTFYLLEGESEVLVLPKHERAYRRAVVAQQTAAEQAVKWHANTLPDILERHQQRAEDVKSFLNVLLTCYSAIFSALSISCSTGLSSNRACSSSAFIAPRHDEREKEASHVFLQSVDYRNYIQGGEVTQPIFGLGVKRTMSLINELLSHEPISGFYIGISDLWASVAFQLEEVVTQSGLSASLESWKKEDGVAIWRFIGCAFLMDEPLLPLPGDIIEQYRNGISRAKLSSLMATYLLVERQEVVTLIVRIADMLIAKKASPSTKTMWKQIGTYLSHNCAAASIMESIWRKWDIVNDRSLPEGVERVYGDSKPEVVWKNTGRLYYSSMSNSST